MMWEQLGSNDCFSRTMPPTGRKRGVLEYVEFVEKEKKTWRAFVRLKDLRLTQILNEVAVIDALLRAEGRHLKPGGLLLFLLLLT